MHRKFLPAAIGALALFAAAAATTPVMACSRTDGRYEEPRVAKPLIEMNNLSAAQRAELKAYAQALKEQVGAIKAAADQAHPPAEKGAPEQSRDEQRKENAATAAKMVAAFNRLGESLSFRTTITVGNGMLCGAQIEVELPPAPDNIEIIKGYYAWIVLTYGKGRKGDREQGQFDADQLPELIEYETKRK